MLLFIEKGFIHNLIYSNMGNVREIWEVTRSLGLQDTPNTVMVISIDNFELITANRSERWKRELRLSVQKLLKERLQRGYTALSTFVDQRQVVVLFSIQEAEEKLVRKRSRFLASELKDYLEEETSLEISIGIGGYYNDPRCLDLSYREALRALAGGFFSEDSRIFHSDELTPSQKQPAAYSLELEESLINMVRQGDKKGARISLAALMDSLAAGEDIKPALFRMQMLELLLLLSRSLSERGVDREGLIDLSYSYAERIFETSSLSTVRELMEEALEELIEAFLSRHNKAHLRIVQQAIKYMEKNHAQELTLDEVATSVHLSSYYFSRIFKRETGMNFVEYLSKIRIERARELLVDGDLNIGEIAARVGYQNPNYFSRVFKRGVGLTPSEYRNKF